MAVSFPSTDYFEALKGQMAAAQEHFSRLGFIDTTFAVSVANNGKTAQLCPRVRGLRAQERERSPCHRLEEGRFLDRGRHAACGAR